MMYGGEGGLLIHFNFSDDLAITAKRSPNIWGPSAVLGAGARVWNIGKTILARIWKICKNIVLAKARADSAVIDEVAHGIP